MDATLIFDVGAHCGEDTEFYLKKGFRVIAVEANPVLCEQLVQKFGPFLADGRLVLVNKAVSNVAGRVKFYVNTRTTVWGTLASEWVERNVKSGRSARGKCSTHAPGEGCTWLLYNCRDRGLSASGAGNT